MSPHPTSLPLPATPATAATPAPTTPSPKPNPGSTPTSNLSPHATPFFLAANGCTKEQRWRGSLTPDLEFPRRSYKEVLCSTKLVDGGAKAANSMPSQPPRTRLRSETHRVPEAAPDADRWRTVFKKCRRPRHIASPRPRIPAAMLGRCFNCLEKGHINANCREPTR